MFGQNEVSKHRPAHLGYQVKEIWYTIQGEGPWAGKPSIFVRFAGCNLRCLFCDTDFEGGSTFTLERLVDVVVSTAQDARCHNVVLTGGEPLLQEIGLLIAHERCAHLDFQIETAGTVWPDSLTSAYETSEPVIVCSPKTPKLHPMLPKFTQHWKYIIIAGELDPSDGLPRNVFRPAYKAFQGVRNTIWVQPCDDLDPDATTVNIVATARVALAYGYRVSVQTHKILGVP